MRLAASVEDTDKKVFQNGSGKVQKYAIFVQSDSSIWQRTITANTFRCNNLRPQTQLVGDVPQFREREKQNLSVT